jgi:hypothetical protein
LLFSIRSADGDGGISSLYVWLHKRAISEEREARRALQRSTDQLVGKIYADYKHIEDYCAEYAIELPLRTCDKTVMCEDDIHQLIGSYHDALICIGDEKRFVSNFAELRANGTIIPRLSGEIQEWRERVDSFDPKKDLNKQFWFVWKEIWGWRMDLHDGDAPWLMNLYRLTNFAEYLKKNNKRTEDAMVFRKYEYYAQFILRTLASFPEKNKILIPRNF